MPANLVYKICSSKCQKTAFKILITQHASHLCYNRHTQGCVQRYNLTVTFDKIVHELMGGGKNSKVKSFQVEMPQPPTFPQLRVRYPNTKPDMTLDDFRQLAVVFGTVFGFRTANGFRQKFARFCGFGYP